MMMDKDKFRRDIGKIVKDSETVSEDIAAYVKKEFGVALQKGSRSAAEGKALARDMLLSVEAGLKDAGHEAGEAVEKSAAELASVGEDIAGQSYDAVRSYAGSLQKAILKALEMGKGSLDRLEKIIKEDEGHQKED